MRGSQPFRSMDKTSLAAEVSEGRGQTCELMKPDSKTKGPIVLNGSGTVCRFVLLVKCFEYALWKCLSLQAPLLAIFESHYEKVEHSLDMTGVVAKAQGLRRWDEVASGENGACGHKRRFPLREDVGTPERPVTKIGLQGTAVLAAAPI